jgi:sorbitol-specific phosphotransferase system component IIA
MKTMMGAIILKTLNFLRERKRELPHVTLAFDEATNANLIGEVGHEVVRRVTEDGKTRTKYASAHDLRRGCAQRLLGSLPRR